MLDFLTGAFGPLSPLTPMPIDTSVEDSGRPSPRRFQYPIGWNIPIGQPGTEGLKLVNFQALRRYADLYSVVRAMLNIRENETAGLTWDVGPTADAQAQLRDDPDRKNKRKDQHDRSAQIVQWFKRIDSNYKGFQSWFQAALEEQFVIDALSLYIAPPRVQGKGLFGSDIAELQLIAGDTVRPLLDIRGSTPRPPAPAYQQYLWGVPRVDLADVLTGVDLKEMAEERGIDLDKIDADEEYRADQMLYLPRLKRTWTPYGFCYDAETEILTRDGWKFFGNLDHTEEVATRSPSGEFEWQSPIAYTDEPYDGLMVEFRSQVYDLLVTPQHRMLARHRPLTDRKVSEDWEFRPASSFVGDPNWLLPATSTWYGEPAVPFRLSGETPAPGRHHRARETVMDPEAWAAFLGLYVSEGYVPKDGKQTIICQSEYSPARAAMHDIIKSTGLPFREDKNGDFRILHIGAADWLRMNVPGRAWAKQLPKWLKEQGPSILRAFIAAYWLGDGDTRNPLGDNPSSRAITTSRLLADDLVEIAQKAGWEAWISYLPTEPSDAPFDGTIISRRDQYRVCLRPQTKHGGHKAPGGRYVPYEGRIYCVSVPNGVVYVRRHGRPAWSGNSPIEQAVMPITIGMNRQSFLLDYFTEGTIPGVYVVAGDSLVTPAQQQQLQSTLNALAGDIAWKHRVIVLPPGSKTDPQKDMTWQAQIDSSIVEQVGMILHIQPHEIGMMPGGRTGNSLGGSGQASQQQESVTAERTEPDRKWWKETTFDWIIQRVMNQEDLEFKWVDFDESEDDEKKSAARKSDISIGRLSIDETRIEDGLDPWGTPYTSSPVVMLGAQVVPLDPSIPAIPAAPAGAGGPSAPDGTPLPTGHQMHPDGVHMIPPAHKLLPDGKSVVDPKGAPVPTDKLPEAPKGGNPFAKPNPFDPAAGAPGAPPANAAQTPAVGAPAAGSAKPGASTAAPVKAKPKAPAASAARNAAPRGTAAKPKKAKAAKITVADLVKGKVRYKGNLTPIVYRYLLRSYPADAVDWVNQKGADWEFEPHVKLSDINMARRPGGRDPDKVESIGNTLDDGASMDPIVLIERQDQSQYKYDIADGWHRCLGAEKAGWDDVPAFIGEGFDDKSDWGLQMQDESDSVKKAAQAELSVLRRYLKKGGDLARFRTNALDSDALWFVADGITKLGVDGAIERGRAWVDKAGGNPDALREWYNSGADGQIDWGSDGDFEACVGVASAYMDSDQARGFCQLRHMDATGETTSEHAAEDKVLKDISLSSPLGTGLVPYDLAGSAPSPATDTCPMCGARKGDDGKCLNGHVLKYSDDEARDEHGRWIAAGGGVDRHVTVEDTRTKTVPAEYDDLTAATVHLRTTGAQIGRVHQYSSAELNDYRSTGSGTHFVRAWGAHDDQGKRLGNGFTNKKSAVEDVTRAWNVKVRGDSYYPGPSWRRTTTSGKVASPDLTLLEAVEAELLRRGVDIAKYSDAQPRDDHGRWTSGGDTSGGATGHGPNETITKFMRPDGTWDPARVAEVHQPALARLTDGVKVVDGAPTVYMTGGGYGSGKSSIASSPVVGFPQGKDAVHVDPDALKADIPEYRATANTDPMAATNAHEESSYLAKQGVALGLAGNHDVVYDTSGDTDPDRLAAKIAGFRALGAGRVEGDYAFPGTVEEAQARADARAANSDGLRRYVPPDLLSANHAEVSRVWQAAADRGTYDTLRLWSTAGPLGSQPSLIAEAAGGKTTVHDPVQFAAFKAIGAKGA
jgi:hypothetical protein